MLRLALELCAVSRRLVYKRAMSRSTANTLTAILAGLGVASDLMLLKLMKPVDTVIEKFPALNIYVIADDVKLGLHDEDEERLSRTMEAATHELIRLTEEDEHMQVSRGKGGKTVALGSTRVLRQKLGRKLAIKGIKVKEEVSNLGVGFALHKKGKRSLMQTKRWHVARGRKDRIRRLGGRRGGKGRSDEPHTVRNIWGRINGHERRPTIITESPSSPRAREMQGKVSLSKALDRGHGPGVQRGIEANALLGICLVGQATA
jgi:hypothetical protein